MITIAGSDIDPIKAIWETEINTIGVLEVYFAQDDIVPFKKGDKISIVFGEVGKLGKVTNYEVMKEPKLVTEPKKLIAYEFGQSWFAKRTAIYNGPLSAAIQQLIMQHETKSVVAIQAGGQKQYYQGESDIAFLYRLAGNIPVWRDSNGVVHVEVLPTIEINDEEIISLETVNTEEYCFIAAGITPDGQVFEVKIGSGIPQRIQEVFHSPAEAREFLQKLYKTQNKGKIICLGRPDIRAGCKVTVQGNTYLARKVIHEVSGEKWQCTIYLS